jgi:hypothetical protein
MGDAIELFFERLGSRNIMSSPYTSLNKYRKLPLSKTPMISLNDIPYEEKYKNFSFYLEFIIEYV